MNCSPLAVHCASLCFDVIQRDDFETFSHQDIQGFYDEVYQLVCERSKLSPRLYEQEHLFLCEVTNAVISVLHCCLESRLSRDVMWILRALESRIDMSIKTIRH